MCYIGIVHSQLNEIVQVDYVYYRFRYVVTCLLCFLCMYVCVCVWEVGGDRDGRIVTICTPNLW